ncbi:GGDEF domain-containing protein [Aquihabitans sp. G128]|uniref:GGDEF domain-containing protein n=1 Tax=Aquihabitans sp. G128 TaxID=2849779 RepID=UPI001C24E59B|nr:GGDEF domain-containing protein [Aquihabitans sp. G128]QXC63017.1 GGDEF domain-containing protein [Aquihabitans sp. G128]
MGEFELLAEVVDLAILRADADGAVTYANSAACELLWRTPEGLTRDGWLDAVHRDDRRRLAAAAGAVLQSGASSVEECRIDVLGETRWARVRLNAIRTGYDEPTGWVAIGEDITTERAASDELTRRATHDALTGLPNRVLLEDRLSLALARSHRDRSTVTVFFLDLDRFKQVNDRHGHRIGDRVLREVAARITRAIRGADTAARLGGDEFVVVAEGLDREVAVRVALRITSTIAQPIDLGGEELVLRASVGVAQSPHAAVAPAVLVDAADAAMYDAKRLELGLAFAPLGDGDGAGQPDVAPA